MTFNNNQMQWTYPFVVSAYVSIRLVGGATGIDFMSGRVELLHNGQWGTMCDDLADNTVAKVICRQLGFLQGVGYQGAHYGQGIGSIWLDEVRCTGIEIRLEDCLHNRWGVHDCSHGEDYSVACTGEFNLHIICL